MYLNTEFKFASLPWTAGRALFRNINVVDLINISQASNSTHWLTDFASTPTNFSVNFVSTESFKQDHWEIRMAFRDNDSFVWYLWPNATKIVGARIKWKIGRHSLITKIEGKSGQQEPIILHSFMIGFQETLFEIVDWLENVFHCKVTNVDVPGFGIKRSHLTAIWPPLKYAKMLTIGDSCADSEWIVDLLKGRHAWGFKTYMNEVEIENPLDISVDCLSSLTYEWGRLNSNLLSYDFFLDYVKNVMKSDDPRFLVFRSQISEWTVEKVNGFAEELNLFQFDIGLKRTHIIPEFSDFGDRNPKFQYKKNEETVIVFYFFVKPDALHSLMAVVKWRRKNAATLEYERRLEAERQEIAERERIRQLERPAGNNNNNNNRRGRVLEMMFHEAFRDARSVENRNRERENRELEENDADRRRRALDRMMQEANRVAQRVEEKRLGK